MIILSIKQNLVDIVKSVHFEKSNDIWASYGNPGLCKPRVGAAYFFL